MLRRTVTGLLDLLAPPTCAACNSPLTSRALDFCDACGPLIERVKGSASARDRAACLYGGPLQDAVRRLKYERASEVAPALARLLLEPAQDFAGRVDLIAVVPLAASRLRARGYNQSALLARPLAPLLGVRFVPNLLRRVRDTPAQVGKLRRERTLQLAHAFVSGPRAAGQRVLVVDDVRTTGASLDEATRALEAAGARDVLTLALARVAGAGESESDG